MLNNDRFAKTKELAAKCLMALAIFGAACLMYGVGVFSGQENERHQRILASYTRTAEADAQRACSGQTDAALFECVYKRVEAGQEQARGEQDLIAQQRAASSSLASAVIAFLTLIATCIGLWFVKRTLDATLIAVKDTSDATLAMQAANDIARQIGQAQTRAYLSVRSARLYVTETLPFWKVSIENSGQSPASIATLKFLPEVSYHQFDASTGIPHLKALDFGMLETPCGSVAPGEERRDILVGFIPNNKEYVPGNIGEIIIDEKCNSWVSATFVLEWIDVFGTKCDCSGSILVRSIHPTNDERFAGIGDGDVRTSVYDTEAWFKRHAEKSQR